VRESLAVPSGGAFYGTPVNPSVPTQAKIPESISGQCTKGKVYTVKTVTDLFAASAELQCMYTAAITPTSIPLGIYYGDVLLVVNTDLLDPLVRQLWKGKIATKTKCRDLDRYISWNFVSQKLSFPAVLSLGTVQVPLAAGEYEDGRKSLIIDYTPDFASLCPPDPSYNTYIDMSILDDPYPINQVIDEVRIVGRSPDGGTIMLGKTYMIDRYNPKHSATTIAFWYVLNYDKSLTPAFSLGQSLPPLANGYSYTLPGVVDFAARTLPGMVATNPLQTLKLLFQLT